MSKFSSRSKTSSASHETASKSSDPKFKQAKAEQVDFIDIETVIEILTCDNPKKFLHLDCRPLVASTANPMQKKKKTIICNLLYNRHGTGPYSKGTQSKFVAFPEIEFQDGEKITQSVRPWSKAKRKKGDTEEDDDDKVSQSIYRSANKEKAVFRIGMYVKTPGEGNILPKDSFKGKLGSKRPSKIPLEDWFTTFTEYAEDQGKEVSRLFICCHLLDVFIKSQLELFAEENSEIYDIPKVRHKNVRYYYESSAPGGLANEIKSVPDLAFKMSLDYNYNNGGSGTQVLTENSILKPPVTTVDLINGKKSKDRKIATTTRYNDGYEYIDIRNGNAHEFLNISSKVSGRFRPYIMFYSDAYQVVFDPTILVLRKNVRTTFRNLSNLAKRSTDSDDEDSEHYSEDEEDSMEAIRQKQDDDDDEESEDEIEKSEKKTKKKKPIAKKTTKLVTKESHWDRLPSDSPPCADDDDDDDDDDYQEEVAKSAGEEEESETEEVEEEEEEVEEEEEEAVAAKVEYKKRPKKTPVSSTSKRPKKN